jgi:hypothetical protein
VYYSVVKLKKDKDIFFDNIALDVDIVNLIDKDNIVDDLALIQSADNSYYNWVSGGGTYLINNRYLIVVKRSEDSFVNPGKYSLFTGRSDNHDERTEPGKLVRELFEELILYYDDKLLHPIYDKYQQIINTCYDKLKDMNFFTTSKSINLTLEQLSIDERYVNLCNEGNKEKHTLSWHINSDNDVNILFLFKINLDVERIIARDAEYHMEGSSPIFHNREIFLLDIKTDDLINISNKNIATDVRRYSTKIASEHLEYLFSKIKEKVKL